MTDERRRDEFAGDPAVDAAWRAASRNEPPARVDEAILAASRAEDRAAAPRGKAADRRPWWSGWQPLASAAAVVGLAFALVQMIPREQATHTPTLESVGAPSETAKSRDSAPVAAPAPTAAKQSVSARQEAAGDITAERAASPSAMAGAAPPAAAEALAAQLSPDSWARRITELHEAGDVAAAVTELRAFRQAYPDADEHLPQSLRGWAASVPGADPP